jgi:predicted alpha/beta superfamily hydrolase
LGGLLTLNSYMDKFSVFNTYIAIDPSIWWNEEMMKNKFDSISSKSLNKKKFTSLLPIKEMLIMRGIKKDTMTFIH